MTHLSVLLSTVDNNDSSKCRGKLGNAPFVYEENNIYVLTIMQHKEEVSSTQKHKSINIASVDIVDRKLWHVKEHSVVRHYPHCRR